MAIVVSDTSAVRALHHVGLLRIISTLYGDLVIPGAVHLELSQPRESFVSIDLVALGLARVEQPSPRFLPPILSLELDAGETEAIALALDIHADFLLIDETEGRDAARKLGLRIVGVVGILIEAKKRGLIPAAAPLLQRLRRELRFHLGTTFEREALRSVGETPIP